MVFPRFLFHGSLNIDGEENVQRIFFDMYWRYGQ